MKILESSENEEISGIFIFVRIRIFKCFFAKSHLQTSYFCKKDLSHYYHELKNNRFILFSNFKNHTSYYKL